MDAHGELKTMGKMSNNKGIAVIYLAISIVALVGLLGLAVDLGYMYVVKGELQNAADAAALASVSRLDGTMDIAQDAAREEAWEFACANKAAQSSVLLGTGTDCTTAGDLNPTNDANGDIVVGFWDGANFTRAVTGGTNPINAVQVKANKTVKAPLGRFTIFFGRIFSLLPGGGQGWPAMAAGASAIAHKTLPPLVSIPLCFPICGTTTLLNGTTFYIKKQDGTPNTGWTTFTDNDTSNRNIIDYINGTKQTPNLCQLLSTNPPVCLYTTEGVDTPSMCALIGQIRKNSRTYTVNGQQIFGWKVFVPILQNDANPCGSRIGCVGDPGYQPGDAYPLIRFSVVYILDAVAQGNCPALSPANLRGNPATVIVGNGPANPGVPNSSTIVCQTCEELSGEFSNVVKLVK